MEPDTSHSKSGVISGAPLWVKVAAWAFVVLLAATISVYPEYWKQVRWREYLSVEERQHLVTMKKRLVTDDYPRGTLFHLRDGTFLRVASDPPEYGVRTLVTLMTVSGGGLLGPLGPPPRYVDDDWLAFNVAKIIRPSDPDYAEVARKFLMQ